MRCFVPGCERPPIAHVVEAEVSGSVIESCLCGAHLIGRTVPPSTGRPPNRRLGGPRVTTCDWSFLIGTPRRARSTCAKRTAAAASLFLGRHPRPYRFRGS